MARSSATPLTSLSIDLPVVDEEDAVSHGVERRINLLHESLDLEVKGTGRRLGAADVEDWSEMDWGEMDWRIGSSEMDWGEMDWIERACGCVSSVFFVLWRRGSRIRPAGRKIGVCSSL
jgi:hypothetical protein